MLGRIKRKLFAGLRLARDRSVFIKTKNKKQRKQEGGIGFVV
jgi:hypothetical protein